MSEIQPGIFKLSIRDDRFDKILCASKIIDKYSKSSNEDFKKYILNNISPIVHEPFKPIINFSNFYTKAQFFGGSPVINTSDGGGITFKFNVPGHYVSDSVLHVKIPAIGSLTGSNRFRYCAYPGMRLLKKIEFRSGGNIIDTYTRDDVIFKNLFEVKNRDAWDRNHGHQSVKYGETYNPDGYNVGMLYRDGPQVYKVFQPILEMYIPLHLWFGKEPKNAIMNTRGNNTQRIVSITLASISELIGATDGAGTIIDLPFSSIPFEADLYVNNIYIQQTVYQHMRSDTKLRLARLHKNQINSIRTSSGNFKLSNLKYPIEHLYVGFRSIENANDLDYWCMFGRAVRPLTISAGTFFNPIAYFDPIPAPHAVVAAGTVKDLPGSTLDTRLSGNFWFMSNGIEICPKLHSNFYSSQSITRYNDFHNLYACRDDDAFSVLFNLYPGKRNHSGYLNFSVLREIEFFYDNTVSTDANPIEIVMSASILNFITEKAEDDEIRLAYTL